jgi:hypothetical protein
MSRSLLALCALATVVVVISAVAADAPPPVSPDDPAKRLESLLQERRDTLRKVVEYVDQQAERGLVDPSALAQASNQLSEAEMELAKTKAEQIAILEKRVANLSRTEAIYEKMARLAYGKDITRTHLEAKAARLKAEVELVREQSKPAANRKQWKIVDRQNQRDLEIAVEEELAKGWEPCGGVSVSVGSAGGYSYTQAMWKR